MATTDESERDSDEDASNMVTKMIVNAMAMELSVDVVSLVFYHHHHHQWQ